MTINNYDNDEDEDIEEEDEDDDENDYKIYMEMQIEEIKIYKWIVSEQANRDLGNEAILKWIELYAEDFRNNYNKNKKKNK